MMKASPSVLAEHLDNNIEKLRHLGVRITNQRRAILKYIIETETHPTVEQIYQKLKPRFDELSLATVYNTINLLVKNGMIQELVYHDGAKHYDYLLENHYHLICEECGQIKDVFYPRLTEGEEVAEKQTGYQVYGHRLELYGLCPECQKKHQ